METREQLENKARYWQEEYFRATKDNSKLKDSILEMQSNRRRFVDRLLIVDVTIKFVFLMSFIYWIIAPLGGY